MGQKFAAFDAQGNISAHYDDVDSPVPAGVSNVIKISDAQWLACISTPGYMVKSGALVAPVPPTTAQIAAQQTAAAWSAYQASAKTALDVSDITILRCAEEAVAVPAAWITYRKALRAIVGAEAGDPTQPLPTKPAYPSGT
ncbi:hypothetical protein [Burkholderia pseudomallei]|uniref:hypothetical protein n=1 Tax=Burkholderia pseudomallei TaxID=28450 RepID=UPI0008FF7375|nr:hypothetical protein [Burkholderia pseudomallei]APD38433.1 hypothetical protein BK015_25100 [Burkholderia pseudomallei]ARL55946.1 hypothetical protein BOC52_04410 [Burkholderia pseudomallei]ARL62682.1 hypothetical protein BOC53_03470 [Burkholderia pseudomallei]